MIAVLSTMFWGALAFVIAILVVEVFILDKLIGLLGSIHALAATYFPEQNEAPAKSFLHTPHLTTSVTINDPINLPEIDEEGREIEARD